jgi:hypothetical protein
MKLWKRILTLGLLSLPALLSAQWALYNNSGRPVALLEAPGGGWVIASERNIFKLSATGAVVWGQRFDGGPPYVYCRKVWATPDGGVIAAADAGGYYTSTTLFKLSASGSAVWAKTYLPEGNYINVFSPTAEGGVIMAGKTGLDLLLLECSSDGEIVWQRSYGTFIDDESATALTRTSDGGMLVLGSAIPPAVGTAPIRLWVLKLSPTGEIEWQKHIGRDGADRGDHVFQTDDGGFLVAGHTSSFDAGGRDLFWLMKLSPSGDILRQLLLNYDFSGTGWLSMWPAADGSYLAAIRSNAPGTLNLAVVLAIGQDGSIIRERTYAVTNLAVTDMGSMLTADGGCLLAMTGQLQSYPDFPRDAHVMKLRPSGDLEWHRVYGSDYSPDGISLLARADGGGHVLAGTTNSWGGWQDAAWVMKTLPDGSINSNCHFIKNGGPVTVEEASTQWEVSANVVETSAEHRITDLVAQPANISFVPWALTPLPALGKPLCTLMIDAKEGGTTEPSEGSHIYPTGTAVQLKADPKTKFRFVEWSGNISAARSSIRIVMDGHKTITASFANSWEEIKEDFNCFVATAAYGDPSHPDVEVLRRFRDRYLMKSRLGQDLVRLYYRYSPPVAKFVAKYPFLRAVSRAALYPVVSVCSWLLGSGTRY